MSSTSHALAELKTQTLALQASVLPGMDMLLPQVKHNSIPLFWESRPVWEKVGCTRLGLRQEISKLSEGTGSCQGSDILL